MRWVVIAAVGDFPSQERANEVAQQLRAAGLPCLWLTSVEVPDEGEEWVEPYQRAILDAEAGKFGKPIVKIPYELRVDFS